MERVTNQLMSSQDLEKDYVSNKSLKEAGAVKSVKVSPYPESGATNVKTSEDSIKKPGHYQSDLILSRIENKVLVTILNILMCH